MARQGHKSPPTGEGPKWSIMGPACGRQRYVAGPLPSRSDSCYFFPFLLFFLLFLLFLATSITSVS